MISNANTTATNTASTKKANIATTIAPDSKTQAAVIYLGQRSWDIITADATANPSSNTIDIDAESDSTVEQLIGNLKKLGLESTELTLALDANHLQCGEVDIADLPRSSRRAAIAYRLEQLLPVDAEYLTVDFIGPSASSPSKSAALAVAAETHKLLNILKPLEEAGFSVSSVISADLASFYAAAAAGVAGVAGVAGAGGKAIVGCDYYISPGRCGQYINVFAVNGDVPVRWFTGDSLQSLRHIMRSELLHNHGRLSAAKCVVSSDIDDETAAYLRSEGLALTQIETPHFDEHLLQAAVENTSPIELRRDKLACRAPWHSLVGHLRVTAALVSLLWVVLAVGLVAGGMRYKKLCAGCDNQLRSEFTRLYPQSRMPAAVISRLESELKSMGGELDDSSLGHAAPENIKSTFALDTFREFFVALPRDLRLRVNELRINEGQLLVDGEIRNHGDAEKLKSALSAGKLDMDSPRTERLDAERVGFTMTGRLAAGKEASP